jgi:hypothetical protein
MGGRRLTLAPELAHSLRPRQTTPTSPTPADRRCEYRARAEISKAVQLALASTYRPKPVHAVSNFGALPEADESSESDDEGLSNEEFIQEAEEAGFTLADLVQAEVQLHAEKVNDLVPSKGKAQQVVSVEILCSLVR